jgi:DNA-binding Xre family transcriptional regulator
MTTIGKYKKLATETPYGQIVANREVPFSPLSAAGEALAGGKRKQSILKKLRRERGLTLELLSQLAEVSPSYLSRLENGTRRLNTDIIDRLSAALGCEPSELLNICATPGRSQGMTGSAWGGRSATGEGYALRGENHGEYPGLQKDLPVFTISTDLGTFPGAETRPSVIDFSAPADWVIRPHHFIGVPKAFGLYVVDEGYSPRYMSGDILYVHPSKALMHRCSVLVLLKTDQVFVKQFHGWSEDSLRLSTFKASNQEEDIVCIPKEDLKAVHKIVGSFEC